MLFGDPIGLVVGAIYGRSASIKGGCCDNPKLKCLDGHPIYLCVSCGKRVRLTKVTTIKVEVVDRTSV